MKTLKLTKKHFKDTGSYYKEYVGEDVSDYDGNLEIEGGLGWVKFIAIKVKGYIFAEAGGGIKAGEDIEAGGGIKAGLSIRCFLTLSWKFNLFAGVCTWKKATDEDKKVIAGKLDGGEIVNGIFEKANPADKPKWYWHIHHEQLAEILTEPIQTIQNRIDYIKANKPKGNDP